MPLFECPLQKNLPCQEPWKQHSLGIGSACVMKAKCGKEVMYLVEMEYEDEAEFEEERVSQKAE